MSSSRSTCPFDRASRLVSPGVCAPECAPVSATWSPSSTAPGRITASPPTRALPLIRIEAPGGNYDYHNKYFSNDTKYFCPCGIDEVKEREIREASLAAFRIVGCRGWGRLDLILKSDGSFQFLEVNTSPGMTGHSLVPMAAKAAGMAFGDLCVEILRDAHVG